MQAPERYPVQTPVAVRRAWPWRAARWVVPLLFGLLVAFLVASAGSVLARTGWTTRDGRMAFPLQLRQRVNVLVMGVDVTLNNRRQPVNLARSDALLLVSFDPATRTASFLSIPRDTRAAIPGHRGWWKINAAYALGGPELTIRTVEQLLGVRVHRYVKLGPQSFARLIDAVGGVWVDVERDLQYEDWWAGLRVDLKKGRQLLSGEQAMGYARFRHDPLGDIGRVQRQQKVVHALFQRLKEPQTWLRAPQILRAVAENTQTNLTPHEVATLGWFLSRLAPDRIRTETLPGHFAPLFWDPDPERVRALVLEMFYGLPPEQVSGTTVEVRNASGVPGTGLQAAARLQRMGFRVLRVEPDPESQPYTAVVSTRGDATLAAAVRDMLGVGAVAARPKPEAQADLVVRVGLDYARRMRWLSGSPVPSP
ncbi:MAG: LCP family protein [Armatimonadota bacterium]|nr:LCP family protein [Armatimonadota bacterium]